MPSPLDIVDAGTINHYNGCCTVARVAEKGFKLIPIRRGVGTARVAALRSETQDEILPFSLEQNIFWFPQFL